MKKLTLIILMASLCSFVNADGVPEYLKDGEITVTLKDGKSFTFDSNEWKVVSRVAAAETTASEERVTQPASVSSTTVDSPASSKFELLLIPQIGVGQDGVKTTAISGGFSNEADRKVVFGGTVCGGSNAMFAKICGSAFSNRMYLFGMGIGF